MRRGIWHQHVLSLALALAAALSGSTVVGAWQQREPAPGRGARGAAAPTNSELGTILDAYAIVQAQNALQLDDEQYGRFVTRLKRLQEARRRGLQGRNRLVQELRKLSLDPSDRSAGPAGSTNESAVRERLAALRALEDQTTAAVRREQDAIDEVLTPRQQARFRVFEEQLERRKLDLLVRARGRAARGAEAAGDQDR
jgi:hypothetical protein